jgi:hypothetical protein
LHYQSDLLDSGTVYLFLQKIFLYWLEALSLMRSVSDGVLAIAKLEGLLSVSLHFNDITFLKNDTNDVVLSISASRPSSRCTSIRPF